MTASFHVLNEGYASDRVASTVSVILDGSTVIVVDPGMVSSREAILGPLAQLGVRPDEVTDVLLSHHHPDHTINVALFPAARVHDFQAIYVDDIWEDADCTDGGRAISANVTLLATPGHTPQDVSTLVATDSGLVVCTHLWWTATGPADDPYAPDRELLAREREAVLARRPALIVPGHGAPFVPDVSTPV